MIYERHLIDVDVFEQQRFVLADTLQSLADKHICVGVVLYPPVAIEDLVHQLLNVARIVIPRKRKPLRFSLCRVDRRGEISVRPQQYLCPFVVVFLVHLCPPLSV